MKIEPPKPERTKPAVEVRELARRVRADGTGYRVVLRDDGNVVRRAKH